MNFTLLFSFDQAAKVLEHSLLPKRLRQHSLLLLLREWTISVRTGWVLYLGSLLPDYLLGLDRSSTLAYASQVLLLH